MWRTWLENKLALAAPNRSLGGTEALTHVRELARAVAKLSSGKGALYGTSLSPDKLVELVPLIPTVTAQLATWGEVLEERHPGEGAEAFARVCREEGLEPPRSIPPPPEPPRTPAVEAFCRSPGDRRLLGAIANELVAANDPIGAHLLRALALEDAPSDDVEAFQRDHREALVRLVWPVALKDFAMSDHVVYFERGLPTHVHLSAKDLGRFSRAQWAQVPVSTVHVTFVGNETLDAEFPSHPLFMKATSLSIGFMSRPTLDISDVLARPGVDLEAVRVEWTGSTLSQLAKLPSPTALRKLAVGCPVEGRRPVLTAEHIEALAKLFPSLRRLELSRLVRLTAQATEVLASTGWPADVLG
jgi:hypothetical protein